MPTLHSLPHVEVAGCDPDFVPAFRWAHARLDADGREHVFVVALNETEFEALRERFPEDDD